MSAQNAIHSTTQLFLDIYDITNDMLIMKDGAVSLVMNVNAINFGLFSEEEQDAVIYAYAGLLNSLNYPIQIVIRSQTKDVTSYLNLLKEQEDQTLNTEKQGQIRRYREFVSNLIKERNVLDKKFFVVIPANALEMGLLPPQSVIPGVKAIDISTVERSVILDKAKSILEPKRDHLMSQFGRIGLFAKQLNTQELIQLFYNSYNPEAAEGQQITDTSSYTTAVVSAQIAPQGSVINSFSQLQPLPELSTVQDQVPVVAEQPVEQQYQPQPAPEPVYQQPEVLPEPAQPIPPVQPAQEITSEPMAAPTPIAETAVPQTPEPLAMPVQPVQPMETMPPTPMAQAIPMQPIPSAQPTSVDPLTIQTPPQSEALPPIAEIT